MNIQICFIWLSSKMWQRKLRQYTTSVWWNFWRLWRTRVKNEQAGVNSFVISFLITSGSRVCWFPILIVVFQLSRYFLLGPKGEILAEQEGVIRSNCIDCLDRTNVTQVIGLVLGMIQRIRDLKKNCDILEQMFLLLTYNADSVKSVSIF